MSSAPAAIELRHLRYFLAVMEELHFTRAANRLHISQPPLSHAIRTLEDELGVKLFHRTSRVVTPTDAGHVFADGSRRTLASLELAIAEVRRAGGIGSALRIGCSPYVRMDQLQRLLSALHQRLPELEIEAAEMNALPQVERLRVGRLDLGVFLYDEDHTGIEMEPLFPGEPMAVLLPAGHRLVANQVLGPVDLVDEVLVILPRAIDPALHDALVSLRDAAGYHFENVFEAHSLSLREILLAVADGHGVALVPAWVAESSEAKEIVVARQLEAAPSMPDTMLAWRVDAPGQLEKIAIVRTVARELRGGGNHGRRRSARTPERAR
jgi:DNA-binding transcriptional LysR family regulator